jgi:paraquat-inducible protein B
MSKKANPTLIGVFVVGALAIALGALAVLGSGALFKQTERYVLYFTGSLRGLDVGAPVAFRGVRVGTVDEIRLEYHLAGGQVVIPVYIEYDPGQVKYVGSGDLTEDFRDHVKRGLRAQLQSQSVLTGKLLITLLEMPDSPLNLVGLDPAVPEIPTLPTMTESLMQTIDQMPLREIVSNINTSLQSIATLAASSDVSETLASVRASSQKLESLLARLDRDVPALVTNLTQTTLALNGVADDAREIVSARSPLRYKVGVALEEMGAAARSVRNLADYLQRHPEALLAGKQQNRAE